jgi:hypothetical protein
MNKYPTDLMLEFEADHPGAIEYRYALRPDRYLMDYDLAFDYWQEQKDLCEQIAKLDAEVERYRSTQFRLCNTLRSWRFFCDQMTEADKQLCDALLSECSDNTRAK